MVVVGTATGEGGIGEEAQAESQRAGKELVSSIQSHKMVLGLNVIICPYMLCFGPLCGSCLFSLVNDLCAWKSLTCPSKGFIFLW